MAKFINTFTKLLKELFRLNNGPTIRLRAYPAPVRPNGRFDILTESGMVQPKALSPETYEGKMNARPYRC